MNRKSSAMALRKSMRPRESQVPGSAGVPSSARRGFANRTILDSTRNSVGGRLSMYGQPNQKDPRQLNEEFIQTCFRRLKNFLIQRGMDSAIVPNSSKLTLRQFETLFLTFYRMIDECYNPPSGNNWMEIEVPNIMDFLGYPNKVTKSILQTVSSKPGPVVGIIDHMFDVVINTMGDPSEAIRLMTNEEAALQIETEELARSTFIKGINVNSPQFNELVSELCLRHKGIVDENVIREEYERVLVAKSQAEATLQVLEDQLSQKLNIDEECADHAQFIEQMKQRLITKKEELDKIRSQAASLKEKLKMTKEMATRTKEVVDAQPMSQDDVKSMKLETADLKDKSSNLQARVKEIISQSERIRSTIRVDAAEVENLSSDVGQIVESTRIPFSVKDLAAKIKDPERFRGLMEELTANYEELNRQISECQTQEEQTSFELEQKIKQLEAAVMFATQDKDALDAKLSYFDTRLAEKQSELLSRRGVLRNCDNQITFLDKELEDLEFQCKRLKDQSSANSRKLRRLQEERAAMESFFVKCQERVEKTIEVDHKRMAETVVGFRRSFENVPMKEILAQLSRFLSHSQLAEFMGECEEICANNSHTI